jgi:hypothetical protein
MPALPTAVADNWESIDSVSSLILDVVTGLRWGNGVPGLDGMVRFRVHAGAVGTFREKRKWLSKPAASVAGWDVGNGKPASWGRPARLV